MNRNLFLALALILGGYLQMLGEVLGSRPLTLFGYSMTLAPLAKPFTGDSFEKYYSPEVSYEDNIPLQNFLKHKYQKTRIHLKTASGETLMLPFKVTLLKQNSPYRYQHTFTNSRFVNRARRVEALRFGFCLPSAKLLKLVYDPPPRVVRVKWEGFTEEESVEVDCL